MHVTWLAISFYFIDWIEFQQYFVENSPAPVYWLENVTIIGGKNSWWFPDISFLIDSPSGCILDN